MLLNYLIRNGQKWVGYSSGSVTLVWGNTFDKHIKCCQIFQNSKYLNFVGILIHMYVDHIDKLKYNSKQYIW